MKSKAMDPKLNSGIRGRRYFSIRRTSEYPNNEFRGGIALSASRRLRGSGTLSFRIQVPVDIKFNARRSVSHAGTLQVAQTSPSLRLPPYGIHVLRSRFIARTPIKFSRVIPPSPPLFLLIKVYRGERFLASDPIRFETIRDEFGSSTDFFYLHLSLRSVISSHFDNS